MVNRIAAFAKLLRLSNGPTAVADVWMGYAVASGELTLTWPLALATVTSLCLYHGGMAMNDYHDAAEDAAEQRDRPIATGQVSSTAAFRVTMGLLHAGLILAIAASVAKGSGFTAATGLLLIASIVAYNSRYKNTVAGPLLMGACRFLNVHLGISASTHPAPTPDLDKTPIELVDAWQAALLVGVYVLGVTWFARDERTAKSRWKLAAACAVCVSSLVLGATSMFRLTDVTPTAWWITWTAAGLFATRGMAAAILQPTPKNIGRGVGIAIQGLAVIDATLATLYAGPIAGLAILALLPLTMLLARLIPQT
ncbi:MAG: UbiA family prenyltransferase [Planctomycetota bacterium]